MTYIVMEIQKISDGTVGTLVNAFPDREHAESKYHAILSAAAVSQINVHSAVMLTEDGMWIKNEGYTHTAEG